MELTVLRDMYATQQRGGYEMRCDGYEKTCWAARKVPHSVTGLACEPSVYSSGFTRYSTQGAVHSRIYCTCTERHATVGGVLARNTSAWCNRHKELIPNGPRTVPGG